jgi:hypothetical protein
MFEIENDWSPDIAISRLSTDAPRPSGTLYSTSIPTFILLPICDVGGLVTKTRTI